MRHFDFKHTALIASLLGGVASIAACATGSGSPATTGTGGSSGSGTGGATSAGTGGTTGGGSDGSTAGGTGGMGTTADGGGTAGPSVCDGAGTRILAMGDVKIDNFEGAALDLGWSAFADTCQPGPAPACTTTPADAFHIMQVAGGAAGTAMAGHYAGTGARSPMMGGYGVGAAFNAAIDKAAMVYCVDVTAFDGVSFWGKAATAGAKITLNFIVPSENAVKDGGDCVTGCYLHPQKSISLTTAWTQYTVPFTDALPASGTARVNGKIQGISFLSNDASWDFSFDEIQYYKGTAPTGPVPTGMQ